MFKNLFVLLFLGLSGCILYWEPSDESSHENADYGYDDAVWFDYAAVDCDYDYHWGDSVWYLDADVGASYVYFDNEIEVGVYIDGGDYVSLYSVGYGMWEAVVESHYYDCNEPNVFDFVVSDVYGNYDEVTIWW